MKIIEANKMIENIRFFTLKLSELLKKCLMNKNVQKKTGGAGNRLMSHRGVLALSHRKQSEDFSKKNRRIVNTKN